MLRSIAAYCFAALLLVFSTSAFRQALSELRQSEPGSLLFGVLQVVIGTSAVLAALGLAKRARWAAPSIAACGGGVVTLLALQPVFTPMPADAQRSLWLSALGLGAAAAGLAWFAHGLGRGTSAAVVAESERPHT